MTEAERQQMSEAFQEWERVIKREVAEIAVRATIEACAEYAGERVRSHLSCAAGIRYIDPAPIVARVLGGGE